MCGPSAAAMAGEARIALKSISRYISRSLLKGSGMENFSVFIAHHLALFYLFSSALVALMFVEFLRSKRLALAIAPAQAVTLINRNNAVVIDIRTQDQYKTGHIIDSVSSPQLSLVEAQKKLGKYKTKPLILVCQSGTDSRKTAALLAKNGFHAVALAGGMRSWSHANLPLVKD